MGLPCQKAPAFTIIQNPNRTLLTIMMLPADNAQISIIFFWMNCLIAGFKKLDAI